jgi:hypothetical protein
MVAGGTSWRPSSSDERSAVYRRGPVGASDTEDRLTRQRLMYQAVMAIATAMPPTA